VLCGFGGFCDFAAERVLNGIGQAQEPGGPILSTVPKNVAHAKYKAQQIRPRCDTRNWQRVNEIRVEIA
jgi:hypothetical protein